MRKPFFWKARKAWYVRNRGKNIRLDADESTAYQLWERMRQIGNAGFLSSFAAIAESYLEAAERELSPARYDQVSRYVASLSRFYRGKATDLRPHDVNAWLNEQGWGPTTRNTAAAIIKRLYSWAVEAGLLDRSPIAALRKTTEKRRERVISREEHATLVVAASPAFRPYLIALWLSGQRPATVATVTRADIDGETWKIAKHKTRGKTKKPLIVYCCPCLATLTRIAAAKRRTLFATGEPKAMQRTFARLRNRLKMDKAITSYSYRHSYATTALLTQSPATVAALLGHTSPRMVMERYGHVADKSEHLAEAARKVR